MPRRPRPVADIDDAMTYLGFMARFATGESRANAEGCMNVLLEMDLEIESLRQRCASIAKRLETLEAKQGDGL